MVGHIEKYLIEKIKKDGSIHITLIDPEKVTAEGAATISENSKEQWNNGNNDWSMNLFLTKPP